MAVVLIFCAVATACVLQAIVIWSLLDDVHVLRMQVCHLAVTEHLIVVGCNTGR